MKTNNLKTDFKIEVSSMKDVHCLFRFRSAAGVTREGWLPALLDQVPFLYIDIRIRVLPAEAFMITSFIVQNPCLLLCHGCHSNQRLNMVDSDYDVINVVLVVIVALRAHLPGTASIT